MIDKLWVPYDGPEWKRLVMLGWHTAIVNKDAYALMLKESEDT